MPQGNPADWATFLTTINEFRQRITALETALRTAPVWKPLELESGWKNHAEETASYAINTIGEVLLRGRVSGGVSASRLTTLGKGARPGILDLYGCAGYGGGTTALPAFLTITVNGEVVVYLGAGVTEVGLGGVGYLAEN
jgi:hypothetical protein